MKDHRNYGSSSIIYSKGGVVLNMVRCALGDTVFFGGLNQYLDDHQYDSVTSDMVSFYNLYQIYFLSVSNGTRRIAPATPPYGPSEIIPSDSLEWKNSQKRFVRYEPHDSWSC